MPKIVKKPPETIYMTKKQFSEYRRHSNNSIVKTSNKKTKTKQFNFIKGNWPKQTFHQTGNTNGKWNNE